MKRLMQSGFGVGLLAVLVVIGVVNTAQLHNLELKVAALSGIGGVRTGPATVATDAVVVPLTPGERCYASPADQAVADDPANLLGTFVSPANGPTSMVPGGTLKRLIGSEPPGLNLIASNNAADLSEMYKYITSAVAYQSPTNPDEWYPDLATKVTRSEDGLVYDVYLREGVKWHKPAVDLTDPRYAWLAEDHFLTADDFKFQLELIKNPQVVGRAAALRTYFEAWDRVEVVDPLHFRVHTKENIYLNQSLVFEMQPMPRWLYMYDEDGHAFDATNWGEKQNNHWYNQKGIGVGMYRFVEWEQGVRITFERNDAYHNTCLPPAFDRMEMKVLKDQQAFLRYLKTRQLDYTFVMPQQYISELKDKEPYLDEEHLKLAIHDEASYFYFGWNQSRPMFADKRVRRALTHALDRQGLIDNVFGGLGTITSGPFDQSNPCYDHSIAPLAYDLDEAKRLLDEAGWTDTDGDGLRDKVIDGKSVPFEFTMVIYGSSTEYETLARVYREALQRVGIKLTAQPLEWAAQLKKVSERDFDAYSGAWVPAWEIDLYQLWHSTEADKPASSNYVSFRNPEGDRIAEALRREFDPAKRTELCHQFHALVHEEQPYTFFYQRKRPVLYWDHMNTPVFSKLNPYRDNRLMSFATRPE